MKTYIVSAYEVNQAYGGPEEGGWWYNDAGLVRILRTFKSREKAYDWCRRLNGHLHSRRFGPNEGLHEFTSVLSEGEVQGYVHEDYPPTHFPDRRPHYE